MLLLLGCALLSDADLAVLRDADGDGVPAWDDCDDGDAGAGAAVALHEDVDGDGLGGVGVLHCPDASHLPTGTDCDDGDATIGAATDWYPDEDGDGATRSTDATAACTPPGGQWGPGPGGDCDDADAAVNPAAPEQCDNGVDDDCDALVDECAIEGFGVRIRGVSENSGLGEFGAAFGDLHGDGNDDLVAGGPHALMVSVFAGGAGWVPGEYTVDDNVWDSNTGGYRFGVAVAAGDVDGDGHDDLIAGSDYGVFLFSGPLGAEQPDGLVPVNAPEEDLGTALVAGDLDGNGTDDLLLGAPVEDAYCGVTYALFTPIAEFDVPIGDFVERSGPGRAVRFTWDCEQVELWGLGLGNAAVIAPQADGTPAIAFGAGSRRAAAGAVYLWRGAPAEGTIALDADAARWDGINGFDQLGTAMAAGDLDGDGHTDLALSAPGGRDDDRAEGIVYVVRNIDAPTLDATLPALRIIAEPSEDADYPALFGQGVAILPDIDGDAADELLVGAPAWSGARGIYAGAVYGMGGVFGTDATLFAAEAPVRLYGGAAGDLAGARIDVGGDLDGDGLGDASIGVPGWRDDGGVLTGALIVLLGAEW